MLVIQKSKDDQTPAELSAYKKQPNVE